MNKVQCAPEMARPNHARYILDDRKLLALAKKNAARTQKKPGSTPKYDDTLPPDPEDVERLKKFHNEMKKRDF